MSGTNKPGYGRAMVTSSAWLIVGRGLFRVLGLISTVILARLLLPADFGLIAMAMLVIGALQVLAESGQRQAIIRLKNPTPEHYNAAWTMSVLTGIGIALLLVAAAPLTATHFDEPRLTWVICLLALRPLMQGFENIGLVDLQRALNFRRDFQILMWGKAISFVITVGLAVWLRSYWALIAGTLAQAAVSVLLSYAYSRYRPWFSVAKIPELFSFSIWLLVSNLASYVANRADHATIASALDTTALGTYTVAVEVGTTATGELVVPPVRALYAVYSKISHDVAALREHYLAALSFIAVVATSTSVGVALVADNLVDVALGEKWREAAVLVPWLALAAGIQGITRSVNAVLLAAGHASANAWRTIAFALALIPAAAAGVHWHGAEGAAIARLIATCLFAPAGLILTMRILQATPRQFIAELWRPVGAAAVMAAVLMPLAPHLPDSAVLGLAIQVMVGGVTYPAALFALWLMAGRPRGAERTFLVLAGKAWARLVRGA